MPRFSQADYQAFLARNTKSTPASNGADEESDIHSEIIDECERRGWQYLHGSMSKRTNRTLGEPDFTILAKGGRVLFVECKSRTGKLSIEQLAFKVQAELNGHTVHIVRSFSDFISIL
jgi:hypothetical protein